MGAAAILAALLLVSCRKQEPATMRLLYWNIQNGMWDGQNDNYDRFVNWVKEQDPDICVWCEAQSIWLTDSDQAMPKEDRYLEANWGELAARYGHQYWGIGGHRDNYPQVITSKYPISYVAKIVGEEPDLVVSHGAGWATVYIELDGDTASFRISYIGSSPADFRSFVHEIGDGDNVLFGWSSEPGSYRWHIQRRGGIFYVNVPVIGESFFIPRDAFLDAVSDMTDDW